MEWIDATLVRYLRENPLRVGDQPGLTRSHESIEALLTRRHADEGVDVEAARRTGEEAARALESACKRGGADEPLAMMYRRLGLTWLELQALLLCLAPED